MSSIWSFKTLHYVYSLGVEDPTEGQTIGAATQVNYSVWILLHITLNWFCVSQFIQLFHYSQFNNLLGQFHLGQFQTFLPGKINKKYHRSFAVIKGFSKLKQGTFKSIPQCSVLKCPELFCQWQHTRFGLRISGSSGSSCIMGMLLTYFNLSCLVWICLWLFQYPSLA